MTKECERIIQMIFSPDKENLTVAEELISQFILKKDDILLKCLLQFFKYEIYTKKYDSNKVPEECEHFKFRLDRYFNIDR